MPRERNINKRPVINLLLMLGLTTLLTACAGQQSIKADTDNDVESKDLIACQKFSEHRLNKMLNVKGLESIKITRCDEVGSEVGLNENKLTTAAETFLKIVVDISLERANAQALETFFRESETMHGLSFIEQPRIISFRETETTHKIPTQSGQPGKGIPRRGKWYIESGLEHSLLDLYLEDYYAILLDDIYRDYNNELKQLLDEKSYFLYSLLAGREDLKDEDFSLWDNPKLMPKRFNSSEWNDDSDDYEYFQYDISQLLDILIATRRYQQIERYKAMLLQNYQGNPYKYFFLITNFQYKISNAFKQIEQLRAWGLEIFHYTNNYKTRDYFNDNLALAIEYNLRIYDNSTSQFDYSLIRELASGLNTCNSDCVIFYMDLAIDNGDEVLVGTLFDSLPHKDYSNEEISRLIWLSARNNNLDVMKALFAAFKLEEYMDFQEGKNGQSALDYAKDSRNDEMVALLEAHGYKSSSMTDFFRQVKRGWSNTKETAEGVGYVIQLLLFGY